MYKTILHDYFYHYKTGFKNILLGGNWYFYFYALIMVPMLNHDTMLEYQYIAGILPMLLSLLLSRMYGGQMSKTFFLCPLSKEQRTQYVREGIFLRIGLSVMVFLVLNLILLSLEQLSWFMFLAELYIMLLYAISVNIYCQPAAINKRTNQKYYPLLGNYELWNIFAQISGIINLLLLSTYEGTEVAWEYILATLLFLLQLVFTIVIIKKFYRQIIRQVTYYEVIEIIDNDTFKSRNYYQPNQESES